MPDDEILRDAERLDEPRFDAEPLDEPRTDELPIDSDVEVDDVTPGHPPVHLRLPYIGLVFLGGVLGTGAREGLSLVIPSIGAFPLAILVINVSGAFALGVALELLLRLGPDEGHRRRLRLFVGTGFMGGYTTYSTLAIGAAQALTGGSVAIGVLYGILSIVAGAAAGFGGVAIATGAHRRAATTGRRR